MPVSQVGIKEGRKGEQAQGLGTVKVKGSKLQKIGLFFTSTNKSLRQFGFILGILFVFTSMVTFWLGMHASTLADRKEAIVFSPSVNVKSEPSLNATIQFVIHEGLKVEVTGADGDWTRINLADGNSGWISSQSIELI